MEEYNPIKCHEGSPAERRLSIGYPWIVIRRRKLGTPEAQMQ